MLDLSGLTTERYRIPASGPDHDQDERRRRKRPDVPIQSTALVDRHERSTHGQTSGVRVIEGPSEIGRGNRVMPHAVLLGRTVSGRQRDPSGRVLGDRPQDRSTPGPDRVRHR